MHIYAIQKLICPSDKEVGNVSVKYQVKNIYG